MNNAFELEQLLVSKIVMTGRVETVLTAGIEPHHFGDRVAGNVFEFVRTHFTTYNTPPSYETVVRKYPDFDFRQSTDPLDVFLDRFRADLKKREVYAAIKDVAAAMKDEKNWLTLDTSLLQRALQVMNLLPQPRTARFSDMERRIDDYRARQLVGKNFGIKMGIPKIDNETFGIQPSDLVSISGWQGTGKSTLLQYILFCSYMQGKTSMIFSIEMDKDTLLRRFDVMKTHVNYKSLKGLSLKDDEMARWEEAAKGVSQSNADIIILDDVGTCTPDFVYGKMQAYKPDLVGIDYISLMTPSRPTGNLWTDLTQITQSLKQTARRTRIPIIIVAQTNKDSAKSGAQLENIAYTRSIGQDSDVALGLHTDEAMMQNNQMQVNLIKNRDGSKTQAKMRWEPEHMMFREWTISDDFVEA